MYLMRITILIVGILAFILRGFDALYAYVFKKTIFTHFYLKKRKLSTAQLSILAREVKFYQQLSKQEKLYFEHRLFKFIERYQIIGRSDFKVSDEVKILIGSVYIMMTFGMRKYLTEVFDKVIVYPSEFTSISHQRKHKGEFNFQYKVVVFSWEDFIKGIAIENDNLHLGVHEFTHALSFHGKKSKDYSASVFYKMHQEILQEIQRPKKRVAIQNAAYFRSYAFTNNLEFMAVVMEYFFESPIEFKNRFPELYAKIVKMLNYKDFSSS